ncbi:hypothetical protein, partial [Agrobacterium sp. ATCC 31749]|uniref:hypothetical protein n=1 Tax=Agrobacterium sp. ATCC 31749 TaxID=82789 RepID=UPI001AEC1FF2
DVRSTGGIFDTNLAPNIVCGVTTNTGPGDNRTLVALFYRTIQQTISGATGMLSDNLRGYFK